MPIITDQQHTHMVKKLDANQQHQTVKEQIIAQLVPCKDCLTIDNLELSHEILNGTYVIWCGECSGSTDAMETIEEALEEWRLMNGDES